MPNSQQEDKRQAAREVIDILHEISTLLVSGRSNIPVIDFVCYF